MLQLSASSALADVSGHLLDRLQSVFNAAAEHSQSPLYRHGTVCQYCAASDHLLSTIELT